MKNIGITIQTIDDHIQSYGYDHKFYETNDKLYEDVRRDLEKIKEQFGGQLGVATVTTWTEGETPTAEVYTSIDDLINAFPAVRPDQIESDKGA